MTQTADTNAPTPTPAVEMVNLVIDDVDVGLGGHAATLLQLRRVSESADSYSASLRSEAKGRSSRVR